MAALLQVARLAAAANLVLLLGLGAVWLRNYRRHGATHTLGLLVFAAFLLVENALWLFLYVGNEDFSGWFVAAGTDVQVGVTLLCGLETVALTFLAWITWR